MELHKYLFCKDLVELTGCVCVRFGMVCVCVQPSQQHLKLATSFIIFANVYIHTFMRPISLSEKQTWITQWPSSKLTFMFWNAFQPNWKQNVATRLLDCKKSHQSSKPMRCDNSASQSQSKRNDLEPWHWKSNADVNHPGICRPYNFQLVSKIMRERFWKTRKKTTPTQIVRSLCVDLFWLSGKLLLRSLRLAHHPGR